MSVQNSSRLNQSITVAKRCYEIYEWDWCARRLITSVWVLTTRKREFIEKDVVEPSKTGNSASRNDILLQIICVVQSYYKIRWFWVLKWHDTFCGCASCSKYSRAHEPPSERCVTFLKISRTATHTKSTEHSEKVVARSLKNFDKFANFLFVSDFNSVYGSRNVPTIKWNFDCLNSV